MTFCSPDRHPSNEPQVKLQTRRSNCLHSYHAKMNKNGEMFADFCAENSIVIGASVFPHREVHKATWVSPDQVTENQIDHIGISKKFRRTMLDVRVKRGADAASNHHLVLSKLQLKLKKCEVAISARTKFNVQLLQDKVFVDAFQITLSNRYQVLKDMHEEEEDDICDNMESYWNNIKQVWAKTCEEVVGKKKRQRKPWISAKSLKKLK